MINKTPDVTTSHGVWPALLSKARWINKEILKISSQMMRSNLYSTHSDINYSIWYLIFFLTIPTWINSNVDIFPFCKISKFQRCWWWWWWWGGWWWGGEVTVGKQCGFMCFVFCCLMFFVRFNDERYSDDNEQMCQKKHGWQPSPSPRHTPKIPTEDLPIKTP